MKVVKAAAQVLNTLWQYRDLRTIYKKVSALGLMTAAHDATVKTATSPMLPVHNR